MVWVMLLHQSHARFGVACIFVIISTNPAIKLQNPILDFKFNPAWLLP